MLTTTQQIERRAFKEGMQQGLEKTAKNMLFNMGAKKVYRARQDMLPGSSQEAKPGCPEFITQDLHAIPLSSRTPPVIPSFTLSTAKGRRGISRSRQYVEMLRCRSA